MTDLRLIEILPLLEHLPTPCQRLVAERLGVPYEAVFAADGSAIAGREDAIARAVADECLALARAGQVSGPLRQPLRSLVPLSDHVCGGSGDVRARLPGLTFHSMMALDEVDAVLRSLIGDVLMFASPPEAFLRYLALGERVYIASIASAVASRVRSPVQALEDPFTLVAAWGRWEAGIETFSELVEAIAREGCPAEVEEAWEHIGATDLARLGAARRDDFDPARSLRQIIASLSQRQQRILEHRTCALGQGPTLDALAQEVGVTRERIRQLESRALESVGLLQSDAVVRSAKRLRQTIGAAAPLDLLRATHPDAAIAADAGQSGRGRLPALLLLYIAGPYELWDDWLVRRPAKAVVSASVAAVDELFNVAFPVVEEALAALERAGVPQGAARDWLGLLPRIRVLDDYVVPWRGTLADKAQIVLRVSGRPLSLDEIVVAIGEEFNVRTLRNYLSADTRFRRLGLRVYGLEEWGGEEYTKISDEIAQEIERRGGEALLDDLVESLTAQFGVAANSVIAYATGPQFDRTAGGTIRMRSSQAEVPTAPVEFTRRCFKLQGQWSYRITVTYDTLRGSGTSIPQGFAGYLQLAHGCEIEVEVPEMTLRFTWPSLLPCVGSLRSVAEALDAIEGDYLFVAADPSKGVASITKVGKHDVDTASGPVARLLLEVGITTLSGDPVMAVADALGVTVAEASWAAIRRRLRSRGEEDLLALVPKDESGDKSGLDDLMALVGV
jgi:hypothetical protein